MRGGVRKRALCQRREDGCWRECEYKETSEHVEHKARKQKKRKTAEAFDAKQKRDEKRRKRKQETGNREKKEKTKRTEKREREKKERKGGKEANKKKRVKQESEYKRFKLLRGQETTNNNKQVAETTHPSIPHSYYQYRPHHSPCLHQGSLLHSMALISFSIPNPDGE
ncbi:MAG: hypothetical protein JOS17DRAFT_236530 [Linnemannia elongata]|nr:MAG: hypothetical protein JOS17DRAFT_236530 [Linnemannia elongata]